MINAKNNLACLGLTWFGPLWTCVVSFSLNFFFFNCIFWIICSSHFALLLLYLLLYFWSGRDRILFSFGPGLPPLSSKLGGLAAACRRVQGTQTGELKWSPKNYGLVNTSGHLDSAYSQSQGRNIRRWIFFSIQFYEMKNVQLKIADLLSRVAALSSYSIKNSNLCPQQRRLAVLLSSVCQELRKLWFQSRQLQ